MSKSGAEFLRTADARAESDRIDAAWYRDEVARLTAENTTLRAKFATLADRDAAGHLRQIADWMTTGYGSGGSVEQKVRDIADAIDKATAEPA